MLRGLRAVAGLAERIPVRPVPGENRVAAVRLAMVGHLGAAAAPDAHAVALEESRARRAPVRPVPARGRARLGRALRVLRTRAEHRASRDGTRTTRSTWHQSEAGGREA